MAITFTRHARERMRERRVTVAEVYRVLALGELRESRGNPVWSVDEGRVPDKYWRRLLRRLRVVCTLDLRVITVYRESRRKKFMTVAASEN